MKSSKGSNDMAAMGNTMHPLHTKSLPRNHGLKVAPISKNGGARSFGKGAGRGNPSQTPPPMQGDGDGDE